MGRFKFVNCGRKIFVFTVLAIMTLTTMAVAQGYGPPSGAIYAHDRLFRTVATPTNFPAHGPFDTIYVLGNGLINVADAAPGDRNFNGGRWEVRPISWITISPVQYTNAEQVHAAAMAGQIAIGEVVKRFECPMIPMRH